MLGSPDSSEPVRHVSNVSKLRVWSSAAWSGSGCITGPLCAAAAAVLASCRQASAAVRQLSSELDTARHISADLEPGSESESSKTLWDDHSWTSSRRPSSWWHSSSSPSSADAPARQTRQLSAFCQTRLAIRPGARRTELAGEWFHDVCTKLFCDTATALTSRWTENCCLTLKLGSGFPGYWPKITMNVY